jgi:hypothetical protein
MEMETEMEIWQGQGADFQAGFERPSVYLGDVDEGCARAICVG